MEAPKFDPNKEYKELGTGLNTSAISNPIPEIPSQLESVAEVMDIPSSVVRAGVYGAVSDKGSAVDEIGKQLQRIKKGSEGVKYGPTGKDIVSELGMEGIPATIAGGAAEMVLDPSLLAGGVVKKALKPISRLIRKGATKSTARVISDYVSFSKYAKEGVSPKKIADFMVEKDLVKYINNPEKFLEVIEGPVKKGKNFQMNSGDFVPTYTKQKGGKISSISDELRQHIEDVTSKSKEIKTKQISNPITYTLAQDHLDPLSGEPMDLGKIQEAESFIKSVLNKDISKKSYTVSELFDLKKNMGQKISSKEFWKNPDDATVFKKDLMVKMIRKIDDEIFNALEGQPVKIGDITEDAGNYYKNQNYALSNLINLRGTINSMDYKDLKSVNLAQVLAESLASGATIGLASGSPSAGLSGAAMSAAWAARSKGKDVADALTAKAIDSASKTVGNVGYVAPQITREMRNEPVSVDIPYSENPMRGMPDRRPQSLMNPQEALEMNLPKKLLKTKLPRNIQGIMENKQLFRMKVAQEAESLVTDRMAKAGVDTQMISPDEIRKAASELYKNVSTALEGDEKDINKILPMWINQYPQMFEDDAYGRINNIVPNSMKPQVRDDLRKNKNIGTREKIEKLDLLNRTGEYIDTP